MSDTTPATPEPPPPPAPSSSGWGPKGKVRHPAAVIIFSIITLGIYFLFWTYFVFKENKEFSGDGVGGVIGLVIGLVIGVVNLFLLPSEVGNIQEKAGHEKTVRGVTGFWNLIPIIGFIIWVVKVQGAMNHLYE
jgi:hypothetical protein